MVGLLQKYNIRSKHLTVQIYGFSVEVPTF